MQELSNIKTIFKNKIFRIPDYQRGYAWQNRQLSDFWEDLNTLEPGKNHYTGVLSLEEVPFDKWNTWEEDKWLIDNKGCNPYFIVDGQQRLTTCIILIQAIIEVARGLKENSFDNKDDFELCDTKLHEIRKEFIYQQRSNSILRSYIFGYEKDNPSYEFLKTKIFREPSSSNQNIETLYTQNLEKAKKFFIDIFQAIDEKIVLNTIESLYKKVTMNLLFNEYIMRTDVDVFVAFETMNNRGKKLSDLELLKNRLIYLSTLYKKDEEEKKELRKRINDAWKDIYFQLGRNKDNPLNDDDFLKAHWIMYFKYSRKTGEDYIHFLLNEHFSPKKVLEQTQAIIPFPEEEFKDINSEDILNDDESSDEPEPRMQSKLAISSISEYAKSIQNAASRWYDTHNPFQNISLTEDEQLWIDRLNRIGIGYFRPLVMSCLLNDDITPTDRVRLLSAVERFIFIAFRLSQARGNYRNSEFYNFSRELYYKNKTIEDIITALSERLKFAFNEDGTYKTTTFHDFISNKFKYGSKDGFYGWSGLRYFLFEYEHDLFCKSQNTSPKIRWNSFINQNDSVSIEHILPQTPSDPSWQLILSPYSGEQQNILIHTLGNLLALSQPKNSALQNSPYAAKRADSNVTRGYFNGSYSEIRVAEMYDSWTSDSIKKRGIELLEFMERRWEIDLGSQKVKLALLNLDFLE